MAQSRKSQIIRTPLLSLPLPNPFGLCDGNFKKLTELRFFIRITVQRVQYKRKNDVL